MDAGSRRVRHRKFSKMPLAVSGKGRKWGTKPFYGARRRFCHAQRQPNASEPTSKRTCSVCGTLNDVARPRRSACMHGILRCSPRWRCVSSKSNGCGRPANRRRPIRLPRSWRVGSRPKCVPRSNARGICCRRSPRLSATPGSKSSDEGTDRLVVTTTAGNEVLLVHFQPDFTGKTSFGRRLYRLRDCADDLADWVGQIRRVRPLNHNEQAEVAAIGGLVRVELAGCREVSARLHEVQTAASARRVTAERGSLAGEIDA